MLTQKQWKIQLLTEHMHNTATTAATIAANLSVLRQPMVREHAIIAEETRSISIRIIKALEKNIYEKLPDDEFGILILELARRLEYLTMNAALVACKVLEHKSLAVVADNLRYYSIELGELFGKKHEFSDIPAVSPRSTVIPDVFFIFSAVSGKYRWYENAQLVQEVLDYCPEYIKNGRLVMENQRHSLNAPLIQWGDINKNSGIAVIADAHDPKKFYAVISEFGLHSLFNGHVGINKAPASDIPVRECWSASDGSDIMFLDWGKMI